MAFLLLVAPFSMKAQNYQFKNYTVDNGLPSSEVYHVLQDEKGYVWFATDEGVSRFNGYQFKNYTNLEGLPDNTVLELYEDETGKIWFISISGKLSWFENDSIYHYPHNAVFDTLLQGSDYHIKKSFYVDADMNLYAGFYQHELFHIDPLGNRHQIKPDVPGRSLIKIMGSGDEKIMVYSSRFKEQEPVIELIRNDGSLEYYPIEMKRNGNRSIGMIYEDRILYSKFKQLYSIEDERNYSVQEFDDEILWISKDRNGLIWIGFLKNGTMAYKNFDFEHPEYHLLAGNSVSSVMQDHEGGFWITTLENGVYYYPSLQMHTLTTRNGLYSNVINKLTLKDDKLFFGGDRLYYYEYDLQQLKEHHYQLERPPRECRMMEWIGDSLFLGLNHAGTVYIYKDQVHRFSDRAYRDLLFYDQELVYCFFLETIRFYQDGTDEIDYLHIPLVSKIYDVIRLDKEIAWLGTSDGLFEFNLATHEYRPIRWHKALENRINTMYREGNVVWIGTKGAGLLRLEGNTLKQYNMEDGLPGNSINAIEKEDRAIWLGTNQGVARIMLNDALQIKDLSLINKGHGLPTNGIEDLTIYKDRVFAATKKGLCYFNSAIEAVLSRVYISNLKISGKDTALLDSYSLSHDENYLEISFVGLNYQRNEALKYLYQLEGVDDDWKSTKDLTVRYPGLPPGDYRFSVKCINSYGKVSKVNENLSFTIEEPYYQTLWFRMTVVFVVLFVVSAVLFSFFRIRLRELKKRNRIETELNRFRQQALSAQMNPHFIYNSLNSVQSYILRNEREKSSEYLSNLGNLMRRILDNSQYPAITLKEELEALNLYVKMEQVRFQDNFEFLLDVDKKVDLDGIKVPPLIIQPYVENAIHHGLRMKEGRRVLKVLVFRKKNNLCIHIIDNGIGRKRAGEINRQKATKHKSFGTEITNKRLSLYSELYDKDIRISIVDLQDDKGVAQGTQVEIEVIEEII